MKTKADLVVDHTMKQVAGDFDPSQIDQWEEFMLKDKYDAIVTENITLKQLYQSVLSEGANRAVEEARVIMELMSTEQYVTAQKETSRWLKKYSRKIT